MLLSARKNKSAEYYEHPASTTSIEKAESELALDVLAQTRYNGSTVNLWGGKANEKSN